MSQSLTIYKASAGSGKTFTLAVEYIMGLLQEDAEREFEKTLAVTFTNKATAEMKNRILETLYGLKMGLEDAKSYMEAIMDRFKEAKIPITEEQVRLQAGKALTAILHDYSRFRVETIDSFFQSILRNMARELGLAANLQVELSHDEVIDSAVDSLIETMDQQPEVAKWVLDYVREQLDSGDRWDIVKPLKSFAKNIFEEEYQQRSAEELAKISNADIIKDFKAKMQAIKKKAEKEIQEGTDRLLQELPNSPIYDKISRVGDVESFLKNMRDQYKEPTNSIQKKINGDESFLKKGFGDSASLAEEETFRQTLQQLVGYLKDYFSATLSLSHLSQLRLLEYIDEKVREIEGDAGRFTLSSTPALLSKMIEGSDAPFIFEKIGTFINNVMIDEFQDTSRMQWNNFKKLLFEKLASGGKGLLVGDIKQSIYRWRNGDWKILYGIEKEPDLQRFNIKPEPLDTNFRSYGVIVDFNNAFFPVAAKLLDQIKPDADIKLDTIYEDVKQQKDKEEGLGYVRIKIYKGNAEDSTIMDMVEQVKRLQTEGLELSKIAILIRENKFAQPTDRRLQPICSRHPHRQRRSLHAWRLDKCSDDCGGDANAHRQESQRRHLGEIPDAALPSRCSRKEGRNHPNRRPSESRPSPARRIHKATRRTVATAALSPCRKAVAHLLAQQYRRRRHLYPDLLRRAAEAPSQRNSSRHSDLPDSLGRESLQVFCPRFCCSRNSHPHHSQIERTGFSHRLASLL